jgi:hypothetical protein
MPFLLIVRKDQGSFEESGAIEKLRAIGVRNLRRNSMPGAAIAGHFEWHDDLVIVELKADLKSFAISDCTPAGYEFAVRLGAQLCCGLRIVNEHYSFDLDLNSFNTARQLQNAVESPDP